LLKIKIARRQEAGIFFGKRAVQMIRELARALATFGEFVDGVIVEAQFRRGTFTAGAEVLKKYSSMALVRTRSSQAELSVKLIRPRKEIFPALGCRIQSSEKIWRVFTASEVSEFVSAIGDENKIHRLNPPIVPALLILEALSAQFPDCKAIKLRFKNFITAGEPLTLTNGERLEICAAGVRKVSGKIL